MAKYEMIHDAEASAKEGITLYRVKALKPFGRVWQDSVGGLIQSAENLSHEGKCWVAGDAIVRDNARVKHNALVYGRAVVRDNAVVSDNTEVCNDAVVCDNAVVSANAKVWGNARVEASATINAHGDVFGFAVVKGNAMVGGQACVHGSCVISGNVEITESVTIRGDARISGNAKVAGQAEIGGRSHVYGEANVNGNASLVDADVHSRSHYIIVGPAISSGRFVTGYKTADGSIRISAGCFTGSLDEFLEKINYTHAQEERFRKQYVVFHNFIRDNFATNESI